MGYVSVIGHCAVCNQMMSFNPVRVPSVRVNGNREPVCRDCIERANVIREEKGLKPLTYAPDAYEACHEAEL